jgi:midasin
LLTRKRTAWSTLLKELKRAGFSANLKPETLRNQQDTSWLRQQPSITPLSAPDSVTKSDLYFGRLQACFPNLRSALPTHHSDLTTRELQRSIMFTESVFSLAIDSRFR